MKKRVRYLTGILLCCGLLSTTAAAAEVSGPESFQGELRLTLEETNIADLAMFGDMGLALSIREDGSLGELVGSITGSGTNLLTGRVVQDGEEVLFLLPELTETVFSLNMAEYGEMMEKMQENALEESESQEGGSQSQGKSPSLNPFEIEGNGETGESEPETDAAVPDTEAAAPDSSQSADLASVDWEAIGERYMEYCEPVFTDLSENIEEETLEPEEFTINGEVVSCTGSAVTISEADMLRVVDATVDFALTDRECRDLLQQMGAGDLSDSQTRMDIRTEAYNSAAMILSDLRMEYYETPWGETAAYCAEMLPQNAEEAGFTMLYRNKGGDNSGDNFDWQYSVTQSGEFSELYFSRNIQRSDDETVYDLYGEMTLPDASTSSFSCALSRDSGSGDYTLSLGTFLDNVSQVTISAYGNYTEKSTENVLSCDNLTILSGTDYVQLSGELSWGRLQSGISYEADVDNMLNLLDEDAQSRLEEEGGKIGLRAQQILMGYFLQYHPEVFEGMMESE